MKVNDLVSLDGSFGLRPAGSAAAISAPTPVSPTFTADVAGTFTILLGVNDGTVDSAGDTGDTVDIVDIVATVPISAGEVLFGDNCKICHGVNGAGSGTAPNIQGVTKSQIDWAIANVTQMKIQPTPQALTDPEKQSIADYLGSF